MCLAKNQQVLDIRYFKFVTRNHSSHFHFPQRTFLVEVVAMNLLQKIFIPPLHLTKGFMGDRAPFRKHHNFHKKKQWLQSKDAIYCDLKEINMVFFEPHNLKVIQK